MPRPKTPFQIWLDAAETDLKGLPQKIARKTWFQKIDEGMLEVCITSKHTGYVDWTGNFMARLRTTLGYGESIIEAFKNNPIDAAVRGIKIFEFLLRKGLFSIYHLAANVLDKLLSCCANNTDGKKATLFPEARRRDGIEMKLLNWDEISKPKALIAFIPICLVALIYGVARFTDSTRIPAILGIALSAITTPFCYAVKKCTDPLAHFIAEKINPASAQDKPKLQPTVRSAHRMPSARTKDIDTVKSPKELREMTDLKETIEQTTAKPERSLSEIAGASLTNTAAAGKRSDSAQESSSTPRPTPQD